MSYPMPPHGHVFLVIEINGQRINSPLRDLVLAPAHGSPKIIFDANNHGLWLFHCPNLYHGYNDMKSILVYERYPIPKDLPVYKILASQMPSNNVFSYTVKTESMEDTMHILKIKYILSTLLVCYMFNGLSTGVEDQMSTQSPNTKQVSFLKSDFSEACAAEKNYGASYPKAPPPPTEAAPPVSSNAPPAPPYGVPTEHLNLFFTGGCFI